MTRSTNVFAHFAGVCIRTCRIKCSTAKGLQNVTGNFKCRVKLLLNWKCGFLAGWKSMRPVCDGYFLPTCSEV